MVDFCFCNSELEAGIKAKSAFAKLNANWSRSLSRSNSIIKNALGAGFWATRIFRLLSSEWLLR
jgi:hypothetical protein